MHVADRVDVHEAADDRDEQEHRHRQPVNVEADVHFERP